MKLYLVSRIEWDANAEADKRFFATPIHIEAKRKYNEWALQFQSEMEGREVEQDTNDKWDYDVTYHWDNFENHMCLSISEIEV